MVEHAPQQLVERDVRPVGPGARIHDVGRPGRAIAGISGADPTDEDPAAVDDGGPLPAACREAVQDAARAVVEAEARNIATHHGANGRLARVATLDGQAGREPVLLTGLVLENLPEAETLEPRRGPRREVSCVVVAVDDHRAV